jgi:hypothetical protein
MQKIRKRKRRNEENERENWVRRGGDGIK